MYFDELYKDSKFTSARMGRWEQFVFAYLLQYQLNRVCYLSLVQTFNKMIEISDWVFLAVV